MSLVPRDERLLQLLVATGHLAPEQAEICRAELATRTGGPRLRELLIERGLVGEDALEELFGDEEDRARSGVGRKIGHGHGHEREEEEGKKKRREERNDPDEDSARELEEEAKRVAVLRASASLPTRAPSDRGAAKAGSDRGVAPVGEDETRDVSPPAPGRKSSGQAPAPRPKSDERRGEDRRGGDRREVAGEPPPSGERREKDRREKERRGGRLDPRHEVNLTAPEPGEASTRRFDPAALAAASLAPPPRRLPLVVLLGAGALVVGVGFVVGRGGDPEDDPGPQAIPITAEVFDPLDAELPGVEPEPVAPVAPPTSLAIDPWPETLEQVGILEEGEEYARARELLEALPAAVRAARVSEHAPLLERLRALEAFRERVLEARREAATLRGAGRLDQAVDLLSALQTDDAALQRSPTGRRLAEDLLELRLILSQAPAPGPETSHPAPAASTDQLARARQRVEELRGRIAAEKAQQGQVEAAEATRAREASLRAPLQLELLPGLVLSGVSVVELDRRGCTLLGESGRLRYEWTALPRAVALKVRRLAVREEVGEDHFRLGMWCLSLRMFESARQAFQKAIQLEPRLISRVPDAASIARAAQVFAGDLTHTGTALQVEWAFERASELRDWREEGKTKLELNDSRLVLRGGSGVSLAALKEVGFDQRVEVSATLAPAGRGSSHLLGVRCGTGTPAERAWLVAVNARGDLALLELLPGKAPVALEVARGAATGERARVSLELQGERLRVRARGQTVVRAQVAPTWERVNVLLGVHTRAASATAGLTTVQVKGRVRTEWLRKALGELDGLLAGIEARLAELPVFAEPEGKAPQAALSAEETPDHHDASDQALDAYRMALAHLEGGDLGGAHEATRHLAIALELAPGLAAARYRMGQALELLGRPRQALLELERAERASSGFPEAAAARSRVLCQLGLPEKAIEAADQATRVRPDYAPAWAARAQARFLQGDLAGALEDLELAQALDPWDARVRAARRNVGQVLRGPPWEKPFEVETAHYRVRTDISLRRCQEYAELLEAARGFFARHFGVEGAEDDRKATVLVFDTREGFQAYAELTTDDRVESLLGCYLPRYGQLLLYEDKDDPRGTETRRVLCHEAFHQFVEPVVPDIPYWLSEGLAEYFATLELSQGGISGAGGVLPGRLKDLRRLFQERGGPLPLAGLMQETPAEFYSGPVAAKYAQAWALVRWLEKDAPEPLRRRHAQYLRRLREGSWAGQAFREAWEQADWPEVERAFAAWVKGL